LKHASKGDKESRIKRVEPRVELLLKRKSLAFETNQINCLLKQNKMKQNYEKECDLLTKWGGTKMATRVQKHTA
jgi:hypothetical protein